MMKKIHNPTGIMIPTNNFQEAAELIWHYAEQAKELTVRWPDLRSEWWKGIIYDGILVEASITMECIYFCSCVNEITWEFILPESMIALVLLAGECYKERLNLA